MISEPRPCPVCASSHSLATLFAQESIDQSKLTGFSFASRKDPEYMSHRLMRCRTCDLVYVANAPHQRELAEAYHAADYDSSDEANDAAISYVHALRPIMDRLFVRNSVLEIGAGNGVLLEFLREEYGFKELIGVEPSSAAIAAAPSHRHGWLREGIFEESDFAENSLDLICCFMTMEHVQDPMKTAQAAFRLLKPGGVFVTVTHDYRSVVNRVLGKKSPIIDVEHMQIFSKRSIGQLFVRSGYRNITIKTFVNHYSISYWIRLAPIPAVIKVPLRNFLSAISFGRFKIGLSVGNTISAGFK